MPHGPAGLPLFSAPSASTLQSASARNSESGALLVPTSGSSPNRRDTITGTSADPGGHTLSPWPPSSAAACPRSPLARSPPVQYRAPWTNRRQQTKLVLPLRRHRPRARTTIQAPRSPSGWAGLCLPALPSVLDPRECPPHAPGFF
ncbi:hypothetical protein NDU88_006261 [Pleurodeles waltl]|uniref:Uncharacterized protein n=1 Tax=Pleurodeles waltl TaxID=8319 RepID=A0AAV7MYR7_PLEWA|nr:hypothetical protein NDU88_006261 [Pleurodeles waltl]